MDISKLSISQIKEKLDFYTIEQYPEFVQSMKDDSRKGVQDIIQMMNTRYDNYQKELIRIESLKAFEFRLSGSDKLLIAGIDEVGRGPLAGPVVSCAVVLPVDSKILYINDSKKLTPSKRQELCSKIKQEAVAFGIGIIQPNEIDEINIYESTIKSMEMAVNNLQITPHLLLIDAMKLKNVTIPQKSVIKGDEKCYSIGAASIVAKVTRDSIMDDYHEMYPYYNFLSNKGYGTREHMEAIKKYGISPIHRISFLTKLTLSQEQTDS